MKAVKHFKRKRTNAAESRQATYFLQKGKQDIKQLAHILGITNKAASK